MNDTNPNSGPSHALAIVQRAHGARDKGGHQMHAPPPKRSPFHDAPRQTHALE